MARPAPEDTVRPSARLLPPLSNEPCPMCSTRTALFCGAVTVVSGFGPGSDWYRNLLAHPSASIQLGARVISVRTVLVPPDQAAEVMVDYARRHPRAARSVSRFMGFAVDGSDGDYRAVGRQLPVLRLEPQ